MEACKIDVCSYKTDEDAVKQAICQNIAQFADGCFNEGFDFKTWRRTDFCREYIKKSIIVQLYPIYIYEQTPMTAVGLLIVLRSIFNRRLRSKPGRTSHVKYTIFCFILFRQF